jgi:single-strand DNA-binding protein
LGHKANGTNALPDEREAGEQGETTMAVNTATVIGNLGADPQVRALPSGQSVANLSLATTERFTDRNGGKQQRTEWHRIVAFGKLADTCAHLSKGRQVCVEGRLTTREYEAKDGSGKRYRTEIVARQIHFLGRRTDASDTTAENPNVPFKRSASKHTENKAMANFIVTMSALILAVSSGYKLYKMSKYEFENRTVGGVIEFRSYGAFKAHFALKGILRLVLVVSIIAFLLGMAS